MVYSVYWIRCVSHSNPSSDGYIGITKELSKRFAAHKRRAPNLHFRNAILKYGWENLNKTVLVDSLDKEAAELLELMLRPSRKIGWNENEGGISVPVFSCSHVTEHSKLLISASKAGQKNPSNKLSPRDVISIYYRSLSEEKSISIAQAFGIADTTVAKIKYLRKPYYKGVIEQHLKENKINE